MEKLLFYPAFLLGAWTMCVLIRLAILRIIGLRKGTYGANNESPPHLINNKNNFENLTQVPTLFYAGILFILFFGAVDSIFINLAWGYVAFRIIHSLIHLTINYIPLRFFAFLISNIINTIIWIRILVIISTRSMS